MLFGVLLHFCCAAFSVTSRTLELALPSWSARPNTSNITHKFSLYHHLHHSLLLFGWSFTLLLQDISLVLVNWSKERETSDSCQQLYGTKRPNTSSYIRCLDTSGSMLSSLEWPNSLSLLHVLSGTSVAHLTQPEVDLWLKVSIGSLDTILAQLQWVPFWLLLFNSSELSSNTTKLNLIDTKKLRSLRFFFVWQVIFLTA